MTVLMWLVLGWVTGVLSLMQWQVWQTYRKRNDPEQVNPNFVPMEERLQSRDWDPRELEPIHQGSLFVPTPRDLKTPALEECPECGKAFKRVSQHMRMKHPVTPSDSTPE